MVQICTANLGNTRAAEAAVSKAKKKIENYQNDPEYILSTDIGSAGFYLSTAGERFMQCGESDVVPTE